MEKKFTCPKCSGGNITVETTRRYYYEWDGEDQTLSIGETVQSAVCEDCGYKWVPDASPWEQAGSENPDYQYHF